MVRNQGRVTRFVVMAVLQAARAQALGLPEKSAYSWGLNRAIFYAAAKRGFREGSSATSTGEGPTPAAPRRESFRLGDEEALVERGSPEPVFRIGGEPQTADAFRRQVITRFGTPEHFLEAWTEALRVMESVDGAALESRRRFYDEVYRPRRDELSDRWTQEYSPPATSRRLRTTGSAGARAR